MSKVSKVDKAPNAKAVIGPVTLDLGVAGAEGATSIYVAPEVVKEQQEIFKARLDELASAQSQYSSIEKAIRENKKRTAEINARLKNISAEREGLIKHTGTPQTKELKALRAERRDLEIELEDIAESDLEMVKVINRGLPELNSLAGNAYSARQNIAISLYKELAKLEPVLVYFLGSIVGMLKEVDRLDLPINNIYSGAANPVEHKIEMLSVAIKRVANSSGCARTLLTEAGVKDIPIGRLDRKKIGSPLAYRKVSAS